MVWIHELKIVEMRICGVSRRPYLVVAWATVDAASVAFTRSIYHLSVTILPTLVVFIIPTTCGRTNQLIGAALFMYVRTAL